MGDRYLRPHLNNRENMYVEKRGNNMIRLRRLRGSEAIRNMVRENRVNKEDLVYPMFVAEGTGIKNPVD